VTILTIPAALPFLDVLADGLLEESGGDPLRLAAMTVLLPTRRACLAMRESFLRRSEGVALLLPRLVPLGDIDAEELELADVSGTLDLPPAISGLKRQLLLAELVMARDGMLADQAAALAADLARLIDQLATERVDFRRFATLVPEDYAEHWQRILTFLAIIGDSWPAILAEQGLVDPAERRNLVLAAQAARWRDDPPDGAIVAAGSTGSIPATADLLAVIACLPQGRVVLPGLDRALDAESWAALEPTHPQFGMKQLLERLGIERHAVGDWPALRVGASHPGRARLLRAALNPLPLPLPPRAEAEAALAGVALVECLNPQQEAGAIALMLREKLEVPGATAALVTPDRDLARRVAAELQRFGVLIDDSAGTPLDRTAPGTFLRLLLTMIEADGAPAELLALLQHPLSSGGEEPLAFRSKVRLLDREVMRGPRPEGGLAGLTAAILRARQLSLEDRRALADWAQGWLRRLAPLAALFAEDAVSIPELLTAHVLAAEGLAGDAARGGAESLWAGDAGDAAADFVADLAEAAQDFPLIEPKRYPALFDTLMQGRVVRPRYGRHPRLAILGPLEARLQRADRIILAGLNEGTWPAEPAGDPWLSRPMRRTLGLSLPERRIGQAAHDFVQAFAAEEVILTRSQRVEGAPTVPSRWLQRLETSLVALGLVDSLKQAQGWTAWQQALDRPRRIAPVAPPAPCPPVSARPRRLSVTEIEMWMRDPYALYAKHILELAALEPIDAEIGAAERGKFIHRALDRFVRAFPDAIPADAYQQLLEFGREAFGPMLGETAVWAFWWPRFERIARWVVAEERRRRPVVQTLHTEAKGEMKLVGPAGDFQLVGKADRIERRRDGGLVLIDYKTGSLPAASDIEAGLAAQLPLEAVMAKHGAFPGLEAEEIACLEHWRLSGGDPPGEVKAIADAQLRIEAAEAGLERLIATFDDPATVYQAQPHPARGLRFNDYAHLARIKEWAVEESDER